MRKIAASLLNVENNEKANTTNTLIENGLTWVHYDIMDGIFVPATALTLEDVTKNVDLTEKHFVDIHLMVSTAENYIEKFKDVADLITFHHESESYEVGLEIVKNNQNRGFKQGIALNPKTNIEQIYDYIPFVDVVLVMSVQPGAGGQKFNENALNKISKLRKYIDERGLDVIIEVDGGINNITGPQAFDAGADVLVSGSYLCSEPTEERLNSIKGK
ncbi:ribulose-phosphate 3-epimerase [Mycoplasma todarodis]|uniref:Ribulose-phosphate 3-epimerase n=1 Tax=Mycoplasma todarodis TaxID=1937191 RepID=A0A4R0XJA6_9MOLU|nr:ribulose-phosphate 3-epimerase [Mycoplasma todarodis]TCG10504.1 ribulose-phosphate 3-epimerase [Mycoplasma todarodis]